MTPTPGPMPRHNFIMAGQSNSSGRGNAALPTALPYASRVKTYTNAATWIDAKEPVDNPRGQVDTVSVDMNAGFSAGTSFGSSLAALRPGIEVGLIPCAVTGVAISSWARNLSRSTLYGSMIARAKEAEAAGPIKGLLWYQGESNTTSSADARAWGPAFLALVANVRADLGIPDLAVILTVLHTNPGTGEHIFWNWLQNDQRAIKASRVGIVSAADFVGVPGEPVHIDAVAQIELGRRYALEMHRLLR